MSAVDHKEWDAHVRRWCERCVHNVGGRRACPVRRVMDISPGDAMASSMVRSGRCNQYQSKIQ